MDKIIQIKMKKILIICLFIVSGGVFSQQKDTLKVMSYNLLRFPSVSPERIDTLKSILAYVKPDIFMVCELTSGAGGDDILFNALNEDGVDYYDMADYMDSPGSQNELYFNTNKLGLYEQNKIPTVLRDINEYVLYYKSDDIETTLDTTFFYVYVCHLKASSGFEAQRNNEVIALKTYLASRNRKENVLVGGDFNFYGSSTEPAWNTLLNEGDIALKDPINTPGDWHTNSGYAWLHTQSTRTTEFDGGAFGGMDDRFDFIFISEDLRGYLNGAKYINGSYRAVGQDGLRYNNSLIEAPTNNSEPAYIISNLYHMSDHLPIYMEIEVVKEGASLGKEKTENLKATYNAQQQLLQFNKEVTGILFLYSISGELILKKHISEVTDSFAIEALAKGGYIVQLSSHPHFEFKFVK